MHDKFREIMQLRGARAYPSVREFYNHTTNQMDGSECIRVDYTGGGREFHFPGGGREGHWPLTPSQEKGLTIGADVFPRPRLSWWQRLCRKVRD